MADKEIIRETHTNDGGMNMIIGIVVVLLLAVIIYFFASWRAGFLGWSSTWTQSTTSSTTESTDVNLNPAGWNTTTTTDTTTNPATPNQ